MTDEQATRQQRRATEREEEKLAERIANREEKEGIELHGDLAPGDNIYHLTAPNAATPIALILTTPRGGLAMRTYHGVPLAHVAQMLAKLSQSAAQEAQKEMVRKTLVYDAHGRPVA